MNDPSWDLFVAVFSPTETIALTLLVCMVNEPVKARKVFRSTIVSAQLLVVLNKYS
jgi:hypothetical protein